MGLVFVSVIIQLVFDWTGVQSLDHYSIVSKIIVYEIEHIQCYIVLYFWSSVNHLFPYKCPQVGVYNNVAHNCQLKMTEVTSCDIFENLTR